MLFKVSPNEGLLLFSSHERAGQGIIEVQEFMSLE
jgi:hypothetical protein